MPQASQPAISVRPPLSRRVRPPRTAVNSDASSAGGWPLTRASEPVCTDVELTYNSAAHDNVATCSYTPERTQTDQLPAQYAGYGEYAESGSGVNLTVTQAPRLARQRRE